MYSNSNFNRWRRHPWHGLRTRSEEAAGRAEAVLAAPVSRRRWAGGHVAVAAAGTVGILALAGAGVGVGYAAIVGEWEWVARMLGAGLVMVPAMWIIGGVALVAYGISPKLALASWGYYAFVLVVGMLGALLELPQWVLNLSPFEHVPAIPSEAMSWGPVVVLVATAAALAAVGFGALRRRDLS